MLTRNIATSDRLLRAVVATPALVGLGVLVGQDSTAATVLFCVAGVVLGTAILGWCPVHRLLGTGTLRPHASPDDGAGSTDDVPA